MTICTYSCGHSFEFRASAPRKGELIYCRSCYEYVQVKKTKRVNDNPRVKDEGVEEDE